MKHDETQPFIFFNLWLFYGFLSVLCYFLFILFQDDLPREGFVPLGWKPTKEETKGM